MKTLTRTLSLTLPLLLLLHASAAYGIDYGGTMAAAVKAALGKDFKGFRFLSYPTNNDGVVTMYAPGRFGDPIAKKDFLCDTWNCLGVDDDKIPEPGSADWLRVRGYAAPGTGAPLTLTQEAKRAIALQFVLPEIFKILNLNFDASWQSKVTADIVLGEVTVRDVRREPMETFLGNLPANSKRRKAFDAGRLAMVVSDVVVSGFEVTLDVDKDSKAQLDAALTGPVGKIFGSDNADKQTKFQFKAEKDSSGKYHLKTIKPLIVAVLAKRQPGPRELGNNDDRKRLDKWIPTELPLD